MSRRYEDEQKVLAEKIKKLRSEIEKQSSRSVTADMFIGLVRKYTRARKLMPRMLNELIEKIEVFNAEKIDGVWEQRLRIHYNCVGTIEIPTVLSLPIPDLVINAVKVRHHFIELISEYGLSLVSIFVAYIWIQYRYVIKHKRKGAI